jgi:hypothetical protein
VAEIYKGDSMIGKGKSNQNIRVRGYNPLWASHIPILAKIMQISNGPVMELGIGIYSSPLLHTFCDMEKRFLDSYEDHEDWYDYHGMFKSDLHHITFVKDWSTIPIEKRHWGVIFIDHVGDRRSVDAIRAAQNADYVVLHDSNGRDDYHYHYSRAYPYFKYRYIFNKIHPHTTIVSNFKTLNL